VDSCSLALNKVKTDAEILRSSLKDPKMFGMLVDKYEKLFLRKALYLIHSRETAEDAVQDTFLKIYKNAGRFSEKEGANFSSWAYKILTNTCYDYLAKKSMVTRLDLADLDVSAQSTPDNREEVSFVHSIMKRLPERLSRLLYLYFFEEKSYEEIASIEEQSISAIKSGLYRARKQFKQIATEIV